MGTKNKSIALMLSLVTLFALFTLQPFTVIATSNSSNTQENWSMFRSDPCHDGVGTDSSTNNSVLNPTQLWQTNLTWKMTETKFQYRERSLTEPTVVNGVMYICASASVTFDRYHGKSWMDVYALNATNGAEIWDFTDTSSRMITPPAVVNDIVYFATNRYICALKASDGSLLWNFSAGTFVSIPVVSQNMLFIGSGLLSEGTLLALNASNGFSIWNFTNTANSRTFGTPL